MALDDSVQARRRVQSPSSILDAVNRTADSHDPAAPKQAPRHEPEVIAAPDHADPLPTAESTYKAAGRNMARPLETIFFVPKGWLPRGFAYANLEEVYLRESDDPGQGPLLVVRFAGSRVTEVVMSGRLVKQLLDGLGRRVCPWLWELPRDKDFKSEDAPCITGMKFELK
jgi:hypothetical protein